MIDWKKFLEVFITSDADFVLEHLSNKQYATASNIADLPEWFGANTPTVPFIF